MYFSWNTKKKHIKPQMTVIKHNIIYGNFINILVYYRLSSRTNKTLYVNYS